MSTATRSRIAIWATLQREVADWHPRHVVHRVDVEQLLGTMGADRLIRSARHAMEAGTLGYQRLAQSLEAEAIEVADPHLSRAMRLLTAMQRG